MTTSNSDTPTTRPDQPTTTTTSAPERHRITAIWPGEWWIVVNLYLLVVLLLAVAGTALER